jgi:hypothetical protein
MNIVISTSGFVVDLDTGNSFATNPLGIEVIRMLTEGKEYEEIKKYIMGKYRMNEFAFESDYKELIKALNKVKSAGH